MRKTAIAAMLCAAAFASSQQAPKQSIRRANTMQNVEDYVPLPPDRDCYYYEAYRWNDGECGEQWEDWDYYCWDWWTPMCETVYDAYYNSDIDFAYPTRPDESCGVGMDQMSERCFYSWETLVNQCGDATDQPYYWTDECEMGDKFGEAYSIWYGWDDLAVNMKRSREKMRPKIQAKKSANINRKTLAQKDAPVSKKASAFMSRI